MKAFAYVTKDAAASLGNKEITSVGTKVYRVKTATHCVPLYNLVQMEVIRQVILRSQTALKDAQSRVDPATATRYRALLTDINGALNEFEMPAEENPYERFPSGYGREG